MWPGASGSALSPFLQPFHSPFGGDVLYAVTAAEVDSPALDDLSLGAAHFFGRV